jgi:hypothetical protein
MERHDFFVNFLKRKIYSEQTQQTVGNINKIYNNNFRLYTALIDHERNEDALK